MLLEFESEEIMSPDFEFEPNTGFRTPFLKIVYYIFMKYPLSQFMCEISKIH